MRNIPAQDAQFFLLTQNFGKSGGGVGKRLGHTVGGNKSWSIKNAYINICVVIKGKFVQENRDFGRPGLPCPGGGPSSESTAPPHLRPTSRTLPRDLPDESHGGG